jgi:hypothetical protein
MMATMYVAQVQPLREAVILTISMIGQRAAVEREVAAALAGRAGHRVCLRTFDQFIDARITQSA